jgi:tyrosine-protein phosphatase non-receptor type 9
VAAAPPGGGGGGGTPVLHCSAGIGRTGTFIAVDVLLRRVDAWFREGGPTKEEVEAALDVPQLVHSMRQQRGGMVQTLEQYVFLYQAALDELEERQSL